MVILEYRCKLSIRHSGLRLRQPLFAFSPDDFDRIALQASKSSRNRCTGSKNVMLSHSRFCREHSLISGDVREKKLIQVRNRRYFQEIDDLWKFDNKLTDERTDEKVENAGKYQLKSRCSWQTMQWYIARND